MRARLFALLLACCLSVVAWADTAPVAHWDFNEGKGNVLHDRRGNNDGKIHGGTWVEAPDGHALSLDGVDDHVTFPAAPSFYNVFQRAWTVEMWVQPGSIAPGEKMLFDKPHVTHKVPYYQIKLGVQLDNGNKKDYAVVIPRPTDGGVSLGAYGPAGSAVAGEWAHLAATFDRDTVTLTLYKNGVQIARDNTPSDRTAIYHNYKTGAALGCLLNTGAYRFKGAISKVRIYDKSLSGDEVKQRYNERGQKFGLKKSVVKKAEAKGDSLSPSADSYVMPYDVDPPITIDGKLDDWDDVPNMIVLNKKEQVTYQPQTWAGPADLSGTIRMAWRSGFCIAADVTDDIVQQPYSGHRLYHGDHINLWIDIKPALEPKRVLFGEGQYHIAVSPGNFGGKAGGEKPIPPQIIVYVPEGVSPQGSEVVARKTDTGYVIEAFIPFSRLKIEPVKRDQYATFEVALGDTDCTPASQETFITSGTKPWKSLRSRMMPMVFGSGSGKAVLPSRAIPIPGVFNVPKIFTFRVEKESSKLSATKLWAARW